MTTPTIERLRAALAERYEVRNELGRGGMATVYAARDLKLGRTVAIKVLHPELAANVGAERFQREIALAAGLRHPHIVPVFDSGVADGLLYYVMPHLVGESLRARLDREKQLAVGDAVQVAREVAEALSCAHAQGVVHRDIKPENILIEGGHAVVADFGIARALTGAAANLTETGVTVGTPAYMSPEQASADNVDGRSDLYALGCVLYEMLTGRTPFVGPTAASILQQHLTIDPVPLASLRPGVPETISGAITRSLAKVPADRFATVDHFTDALRQPLTPTSAELASARSRRYPWRVAAGLAVVAIVAVAGWLFWAQTDGGGRRITSLAVLPLDNLSGDAAQAYFVDGVHDALIGELTKLSGLSVTSKTSAMTFRGSTKRAPDIARELGVDGLIEGSVFRAGDTVRIQIQFIDAREDKHIWSRTYDRDVRNVLAAMGEVVTAIAGEVRVAVTAREQERLAVQRSINPQAQEHYLRGRELVYRRDFVSTRAAIAELREAIRLDPSYASAHASLAFALVFHSNAVLPGDSSYTLQAKSFAASERAMALDSLNPEGFAVRGYQGLYTGAPPESTEATLRRALRLRPGYAEAWGWLAQAIAASRPQEALAAMDSALRLDPSSTGMQAARILTAFIMDSAELAHKHAEPLRRLRPDIPITVAQDGMALAELGRTEECLAIDRLFASIRAMCLRGAGRTAEAARILDAELERQRKGEVDFSISYLPLALAHAAQLEHARQSLSAHFDRSPVMPLPMGTHRLAHSSQDPDGSTYWSEARALRARAWERVVREARGVTLP